MTAAARFARLGSLLRLGQLSQRGMGSGRLQLMPALLFQSLWLALLYCTSLNHSTTFSGFRWRGPWFRICRADGTRQVFSFSYAPPKPPIAVELGPVIVNTVARSGNCPCMQQSLGGGRRAEQKGFWGVWERSMIAPIGRSRVCSCVTRPYSSTAIRNELEMGFSGFSRPVSKMAMLLIAGSLDNLIAMYPGCQRRRRTDKIGPALPCLPGRTVAGRNGYLFVPLCL